MAVAELETTVTYGMGTQCHATLPLSDVQGKPVKHIIKAVADTPQQNDSASRAARAISEMIAGGKMVDVEIYLGRDAESTPGEPVELDDIVIPGRANRSGENPQKLGIGLSENYVGGFF